MSPGAAAGVWFASQLMWCFALWWRWCRCVVWRAAGWLLCGGGAVSAWAGSGLGEVHWDVWRTEEGLPQNQVTSIVQGRDGYLWLGSYNGLTRFDGVRFVVFDSNNSPGLRSSRVTALCVDGAGTLWVGLETGEVARWSGGEFVPVPVQSSGSADREVSALSVDRTGEVWSLQRNGFATRVRDGAVVAPAEGVTALNDPSLFRDGEGRLWRVRWGRVTGLGETSGAWVKESEFVTRACKANAGGVWAVVGAEVQRWSAGPQLLERRPAPWGEAHVTAMAEGSAGVLWVGTLERGLFGLERDGGVRHFSRTNSPVQDWVRCLFEDREGTLWVGTGGGGLLALRQRQVRMLAPANPDERAPLCVGPARDGGLWMGTQGGGLWQVRGGEVLPFADGSRPGNPFVWSVLEDGSGRVFAGTWGSGLFVNEGAGFAPAALGDKVRIVTALCLARDGGVWVGTERGLAHWLGGQVRWVGTNLIQPDVRCIAEDPDGTVWFGMSGGGLGRYSAGKAEQFRKADGLPGDYVWSLHSATNGTVWAGTFGNGLFRWRGGKVARIGSAEGLPNNVVCQILDDGSGHFWMSSYGGIFRARKSDLDQCADGKTDRVRFTVFGRSDGLASLECSGGGQPAGCITRDGRIWFPTAGGLAVIDPSGLQTNLLPPPVVLEGFRVNNEPVDRIGDSWGTAAHRIAPGKQRFEFHFTALSFLAPDQIQFRYRMEGLETDWVNGGNRRSVEYSHLQPGDYTFRVKAANKDGVWNEDGAALRLKVLPHFWQTWWFQAAGVMLTIAGAALVARLLVRRRYRRELEHIERQRAVETERARIAKDIHDDLGASLTRITLLSQSARGDLERPEQAAADLDQIYDTARELTKAMDEIVWAVTPRHDSVDSLVSYLGGFAQDYLSAASIRCRLDVPLNLPAQPLAPEVRHNLFLAVKEAIHNIVRHSNACEARLSCEISPTQLTLIIQDDGVGPSGKADDGTANFPASGRPGSGNGLPNMRRRLEEIGGTCAIETNPGGGTLIRFTMPLPARKGAR